MYSFRDFGRGGTSRAVLAAVTLAGFTALAFAQAEGPDYFRITGLKKDDRVNVRRAPNVDAKIVGKIPKETDGVKNLGCKGGLTPKQWAKASEAKKKAAARERWCEVEYDGVRGWVSGRLLAEGSAPQAEAKPQEQAAQPTPPAQSAPPAPNATPSFDCAKAEKNWEKLACADNELAAIDREAARLYALASNALNAMPGFEQLLDQQGKLRLQLATCFDRECVSEVMVRRVHQLRRDHKEARAEDAKGISMGPLLARCEGFPIPVAVTYVNSDPGFAYIEWMDGFVVMPSVPSGSGSLYEGGFARFHTKGTEALLLIPGGKEMNCKLEKAG
jgi:membrane-bound inhibitor of C-type lysozyme